MVVTEDSFGETLKKISNELDISVDTETTGLRPYQGDRLFSIIVGTKEDAYYFNFNFQEYDTGERALPRSLIQKFQPLFLNVLRTVFFANATFDMHILSQDGVSDFKCKIHDVLVGERLLDNDLLSYSLASVAIRHGYKKDSAVEEYIKEHKLFEWVEIPGKQKRFKNQFYSKVPFEIIQPYGERDARITFDIGIKQRDLLKIEFSKKAPREVPYSLVDMEFALTKVCYNMEREGMLINAKYCEERAAEETKIYEHTAREFHDKVGVKFIDSAKCLSPIFGKLGLTPPKTETGRDSFSDNWLSVLDTPIAKLIQTHRQHAKIANTYYRNFLWFKSPSGYIHASMKQSGTRTGRFSYGDPNLQNVPDSEVRAAFLAPPDFFLVSIDFKQQEYMVMLDYAREMDLIKAVRDEGLDVHQATANLMGVERTPAKTLNFMLLYGGGVVKLALSLFPVTTGESELWVIWKNHKGWDLDKDDKVFEKYVTQKMIDDNLPHLLKAEELRNLYFEKLPKVESFISRVKDKAAKEGYIKTWAGRKLKFKKGFSYKAPNALIQGGSADIVKYAMIEIDKLLTPLKSKMLAQVHDELLLKVHYAETGIIEDVQKIMENIFPYKELPLKTSVSYSWKNWFELIEGYPSGEETRDIIQRESGSGSKDAG